MTVTTFLPNGGSSSTGAVQLYVVPAGVTFVSIDCWGACGQFGSGTASGGSGGFSSGKFIVSPGTTLYVYVGQRATDVLGGWPGGGNGGVQGPGGGGGGWSSVRSGSNSIGATVIAAGGGGGGAASVSGDGGYGGGAAGHQGYVGGGMPGTQTTGYAAGTGGFVAYGGTGGGGGAGWYGGLGGYAAGGGGGSGFLSAALVGGRMVNGSNSATGKVIITAVNNAPNAPTLTGPANNGYIISGEANALTWTFNNVDPGDSQSKADFQFKKSGDAAWTTLTNIATVATNYTLPAATWATGFEYEWQVRAYDLAGAASPWSASRFTTTIAAVPSATITSPAGGSDQFATPVTLAWTLPAGFTQDAYRAQRCDTAGGTGVIYYDSGTVATTVLSAKVPLDAVAGRTDYLRVSFRYFDHWSTWASVGIVSQFATPAIPLLVLIQRAGLAVVDVQILNPPASAGWEATLVTDLYRVDTDGTRTRIAANLSNNAVVTDWLPPAGAVSYVAVAYSASGGSSESY